MPERRLRIVLLALVATALGVLASLLVLRDGRLGPEGPPVPGALWPNPKPLAPFRLADQDGREFGLERLRGRWSFLFFGYTFCPDVCPGTLTALSATRALLDRPDGAGADTQYVFVSVDPARDTPERLREYVRYFHPDFLGVTGQPADLEGLTRQLGVVHFKGPEDPQGGYLVDHSAAVLVIDPQARLIGVLSPPHAPADMAERFRRIRDLVEG